jgi:hypothetical protein
MKRPGIENIEVASTEKLQIYSQDQTNPHA